MSGRAGVEPRETTGAAKDCQSIQVTLKNTYKGRSRCPAPSENREHFFSLAASLMRRILVGHARSERRAKRDGGIKVLLQDDLVWVASMPSTDLLDIDRALEDLQKIDPRKSRMVELRFFFAIAIHWSVLAAQATVAALANRVTHCSRSLVRRISEPQLLKVSVVLFGVIIKWLHSGAKPRHQLVIEVDRGFVFR
jgi:hypothetical protein